MKNVTIYTTPLCPYCFSAKRLLTSKGVDFEELSIFGRPGRRQEMMQRADGGYTVPQIFIGEHHVGGSDELHALDAAGKLDPLLSGA